VFLGFWARSGTPFAFTRAQAQWDRSGPEGLWVTLQAIGGGSQLKSVVDVAVAALGVALCVVLWRRGQELPAVGAVRGGVGRAVVGLGELRRHRRHVATAFPLAWAFGSTAERIRRPLLAGRGLVNAC
jgi:hypothetical protein